MALLLRVDSLHWALPHTYEEATPLRVALGMSGWLPGAPFSFDPGFFNYPSLTFYLHLAVQAVLFLCLKATGVIASAEDWYVLYLTNPTSQYVAARCIGVAFAALTVWLTYKLARSIAGFGVGLVSALLLATNPYHIARSQMIEVDIPLTCFIVLGLFAMVRVARRPDRRGYALAGIATGLACATKYAGITLLGPLLVAHFLALRQSDPVQTRLRWKWLALSLLLTAGVFVATSPYVLVDWTKARADMAMEHEHMLLGHFGSESESPLIFYGRALIDDLGPWLAGLALVGAMSRRRNPGFLVLVSYLVIYSGAVMTWNLKAERYLVPVLPIMIVLAAAGMEFLAGLANRHGHRSRSPAVLFSGFSVVLIILNLAGIPDARAANQNDARTEAMQWIEGHVRPGSLVLEESRGPDLLDPTFLTQLPPAIRRRVLETWKERPIYAVVALPMYQTRPERSAPFYRAGLYEDADYVITTRAVRGRYEREPLRFSEQLAFYRTLEAHGRPVHEVNDAHGVAIRIYETGTGEVPFGRRTTVSPPPVISRGLLEGTGREAGFYFSLGSNYDYFHHPAEAAICYRRALEYRTSDQNLFVGCVVGYARCMTLTGKSDEALKDLRSLYDAIDDPRLKHLIAQLEDRLESTGKRTPQAR